MEIMDETTREEVRMQMYQTMLIEDTDRIVYRDWDPSNPELSEYIDVACGCNEETFGAQTLQFEYRYCTGKIKMPFTKADYLANEDIIATVKGLGLDVEKFWFALVFIYDYVEASFKNCALIRPTSLNKAVQELFKKLGEDFTDKEIEITFKKGKKNIEILPVVKRALLEWLRETYQRECKDKPIRYCSIETGKFEEVFTNSSYRIYLATRMYRNMLSNILGDKRPKQPDKSVSLNRLLLISRICYFYEFTRNDSFLYSDDSLKGIIKSCKGRVPTVQSAVYL